MTAHDQVLKFMHNDC